MAAICPKCGASIKPFSVRSNFVCRFCSALLNGKILVPVIWAIAIWQLADIFFYPLFQQMAGDTWLAFALRTLVSACIGLFLYRALAGKFATIEIADDTSPHLHDHLSNSLEDALH